MSRPKNLIGVTVNEALTRFPDLPSATLAKKLFSDFPELFNSIDSARSCVRYYRGQIGKNNRKKTHMGEKPQAASFANAMGIPNPFYLPETDEVEWEPYIIPPSVTRLLILSDVHIPYHNVEAVTLALQYGK